MSGILILAEHRNGELRPITHELIAAAREVRTGIGERVTVAIVGSQAGRFVPALSVEGVDEILTLASPQQEFDADITEAALSAAMSETEPALVLLGHGVDSMDYAAAFAIRHGTGFATDVFKLGFDSGQLVATRGGYGQKVNVELDFPGKRTVVLCLRAGTFKPDLKPASPPVRSLAPAWPAPSARFGPLIPPAATDDIDVATVDFIVSVGRGVGEEDNVEQFRELATRLGATLGCSRPIADSGWLPKSRQVGQSGKTAVNCKLYIAMGISGAIQHLAGMKHVDTVVAVNTDSNASIFSVAKYGIVGDMFEIAQELRKQFE
ncbi:MAG TPA: electron transfer flavoprotein subunit alpha/FixB family protein [Burkholderiaceae bacterium]|jgi:electron transfer flavoprotein alpha subunit|nr:electron transfer flavoprotein subunit alpha/FixB family protein [Burkholderiaceae bacterium]